MSAPIDYGLALELAIVSAFAVCIFFAGALGFCALYCRPDGEVAAPRNVRKKQARKTVKRVTWWQKKVLRNTRSKS